MYDRKTGNLLPNQENIFKYKFSKNNKTDAFKKLNIKFIKYIEDKKYRKLQTIFYPRKTKKDLKIEEQNRQFYKIKTKIGSQKTTKDSFEVDKKGKPKG